MYINDFQTPKKKKKSFIKAQTITQTLESYQQLHAERRLGQGEGRSRLVQTGELQMWRATLRLWPFLFLRALILLTAFPLSRCHAKHSLWNVNVSHFLVLWNLAGFCSSWIKKNETSNKKWCLVIRTRKYVTGKDIFVVTVWVVFANWVI